MNKRNIILEIFICISLVFCIVTIILGREIPMVILFGGITYLSISASLFILVMIDKNDSSKYIQEISNKLIETSKKIHPTGIIDTDKFYSVYQQLDQLAISLEKEGSKYLSNKKRENYRKEIDRQKNIWQKNHDKISIISETSGIDSPFVNKTNDEINKK